MSLKLGTLVESHLSMICPQTTHLATLLSLSDSREYVTAIKGDYKFSGPIRQARSAGSHRISNASCGAPPGPVTGHLKAEHRMGRNYLAHHTDGTAVPALPSPA